MSLYRYRSGQGRLYRRLKIIAFMTAILYVLLGIVSVWQAYAQGGESSFSTHPIGKVPFGSDDKNVKAYYDYLAQTDFTTKKESYILNANNLLWAYGALGLSIIIVYFFIFAWYARNVSGDLYPVEVYNGYISERGGPVDPFNIVAYIILGAYMAYYVVITIIFGQIY